MPFVLASFYFIGLLGLGLEIVKRALSPDAYLRLKHFERFFLSGIVSLSLGQILIYFGLSIGIVAWGFVVLGILTLLFWNLRDSPFEISLDSKKRWQILLIVSLFPITKTLFEPLIGWDAVFHWFFQAKILYYDQGFIADTWLNPDINFCHPAYPKFNAILSAEMVSLVGYWNDYWPKLSIALLFVLSFIGILNLRKNMRELFFLAAVLIFCSGYFLWNGYMDSYLGIFSFIAVTYFGKGIEEKRFEYIAYAFSALGVLLCLKNEGMVLALVALTSACITLTFFRPTQWTGFSSKTVLLILLVLTPSLCWIVLRYSWGLGNDLHGSYVLHEKFSENFNPTRIWHRLTVENYLGLFLKYYFTMTDLLYALPLFVISVSYLRKCNLLNHIYSARVFVPCLSFMGYSLVLFFYYMSSYYYTPEQQMGSSISRIAIVSTHLLFASFTALWKEKK